MYLGMVIILLLISCAVVEINEHSLDNFETLALTESAFSIGWSGVSGSPPHPYGLIYHQQGIKGRENWREGESMFRYKRRRWW